MSCSMVNIKSDAFMVCLTHALSNEKEEVMGLLIGGIDESRVSHISAVIMLRRSDKQPDRVEISPEQLSDASTKAEELACELQRPMRVVGWYHSHPHITVWPSHVDVRTQASYQLLDEAFVGLIFSVFNDDKTTKQSRIEVMGFQSVNQSPEGQPPQHRKNMNEFHAEFMRLEVPVHVIPTDHVSKPCLEALSLLPSILAQENDEEYERSNDYLSQDLVSKLHNASVYTTSVCHLTEFLTAPLIQLLEDRLERNHHKLSDLLEEKEILLKQLAEMERTEQLLT